MSRGYAEGPVAEEAERRLAELGEAPTPARAPERAAVFGSTESVPERHFLGWRDELDPDAIFASGEAWGITVVHVRPDRV